MDTPDDIWRQCVINTTKGGAANFRDAAFEFAELMKTPAQQATALLKPSDESIQHLRNAWATLHNLSVDMGQGPIRQQLQKRAVAIRSYLNTLEQKNGAYASPQQVSDVQLCELKYAQEVLQQISRGSGGNALIIAALAHRRLSAVVEALATPPQAGAAL